jgi:hypothetical protein
MVTLLTTVYSILQLPATFSLLDSNAFLSALRYGIIGNLEGEGIASELDADV